METGTDGRAGAATRRLLRQRRSIRTGFRTDDVSVDDLREIVACGLAAPSSKNAQPWRFHVVDDRTLLVEVAAMVARAKGIDDYVPHDPLTGERHPAYTSTVLASAEVLASAPAGVFVENLGVFARGRRTLAEVDRAALAGALEGYAFELLGIGAAVENMWIAANSLGLAAAFIGDVVVAEDAIRTRLGLDGDLLGVLVVGHSDDRPRPPMDERALVDSPRAVWHGPSGAAPA